MNRVPVPFAPPPESGFETLAVHFAEDPFRWFGAASPPIFQTSTFLSPDADKFARRRSPEHEGYDYTRVGNPTTEVLESKLAALERGAWAQCFGSGMGAVTAAINACLDGPAHVVRIGHTYGPTRTYLDHLKRFGVDTTVAKPCDVNACAAAIRPSTRILYIESPTSGYFDVPEIAPLIELARPRGIRTIFDNSWATPLFQNPLESGIDLVLHSATKYLNGHSDVVAGVVVGRDAELGQRVFREAELAGATLDPMAAWLLMRGLRTLAVRMEHQQRSALQIARALELHPKVLRVLHPGLESHPQHAVARRQLRGYSSLFSFLPKSQSRESVERLLNRLTLFGKGVSWGGHESLAIGGTFFGDEGTPNEWLVRLYVGLESTPDLLRDLLNALED